MLVKILQCLFYLSGIKKLIKHDHFYGGQNSQFVKDPTAIFGFWN
jgi:hypothetical protein